MTNPNAFRALITYGLLIVVALMLGLMLPYLGNFDSSSLVVAGLALGLVMLPVLINSHYPVLLFGLSCPATMFFLPGHPPMWEIVVLISLSIAIVERTLNKNKQFIRVPVMTLPLLFIAAMTLVTAQLTGGIQLHSVGGGGGGGKKYLAVFLGVASYFALSSRMIPVERRKLYLLLFILPAVLGVISALFPYLPSPLNYINLVFTPITAPTMEFQDAPQRFKSLAFAFSPIIGYLLARYGLRGILSVRHTWRPILFAVAFGASLLGGFRNVFGGIMLTLAVMFFLERLHRTRYMAGVIALAIAGSVILVGFSNQLPYPIQRSMCFLPLKWDNSVVLDAEGSLEWRFRMWHALWPKVPDYLLLGKGYFLTPMDYESMQGGVFANFHQSHISGDEEALAVSGDYHNGPLSTLIPFGIWGGIGMLWLMGATLFVLYRNYRYGDPELKTFNTYFFASGVVSIIIFFFVVGAFQDDVGYYARLAGFSLAMNRGLAQKQRQVVTSPATNRVAAQPEAINDTAPQPA
jgi:hypothetical protein